MRTLLDRTPTHLLIAGILTAAFGLISMFFPFGTLVTMMIFWGVFVLFESISALTDAVRNKELPGRGMAIAVAVLGIITGLLATFDPFSSAASLTWIMGIWFFVRGVQDLASIFRIKGGRAHLLLGLTGVLWLIAASLFISHPGVAALALVHWQGILILVLGVALICASIALRKELKEASH